MEVFQSYKPAMAMVGLQFSYAGLARLNPRVFVVYRQGIATLIMAPLAYISRRRNSSASSLELKCFGWIFAASLLGVTCNQNAYFEGLYLASSTAASALTNLVPAITFVVAAILGFEKLNIRRTRSIAKILGTILCVGGAILVALLKGPKLLNSELPSHESFFSPGDENWLLGCLLLFASSCFWSLWMIFQVPISTSCGDHVYSSGVGLAVSFFLQAWCISRWGPVFAAMFNPLCTVIVAILQLYFSMRRHTVEGALAVIIGLSVVLWGKAKDLEEYKTEKQLKFPNDEQRTFQVLIDE
ncbi:hypothetical protein K2173_017438 [Erythroxylum novogranatense]|uniref:WAT1-related protein n=1 Tax=Erythroxylum novogranatense TaxID=1862640 RepID=A0AAV8TMP7_9ROSI|nr:hypothetical protein K2173_017438 [Erythroxylum novogranatense]